MCKYLFTYFQDADRPPREAEFVLPLYIFPLHAPRSSGKMETVLCLNTLHAQAHTKIHG